MMRPIKQQLVFGLAPNPTLPAAGPDSGGVFAAVLLERGAAQATPPALPSPNSWIAPHSGVPEATEELKPLAMDGSSTDSDLAWAPALAPASAQPETFNCLGHVQMLSSGLGIATAPSPIHARAIGESLEEGTPLYKLPKRLLDAESELSSNSMVGVPLATDPIVQLKPAVAAASEASGPSALGGSINQTAEQAPRLHMGNALNSVSKHGLNSANMPEGGSNAQPSARAELISQQPPADFAAAAMLQIVADDPGSNTLTQVRSPATAHIGGEQIGSELVDADTHQLDSLMREISEVAGKTGRTAFRMTSEHLGGLDVRLHTEERGVSVTIRTESEQGHATLSQAQKQLADDLRANGLRVAETSVALGRENSDQDRSQRSAKQHSFVHIEAAKADRQPDEDPINMRASGRFA